MATGVIVAVLGVGIAVAVQQLTRTDHRTTSRTVDEALDDFRAGTDAEGAPPVLPAHGVYIYSTSGSDGVDALGGAEHTYPSTTTITVRAAGCGVTTRWDVAVERWDETTTCAANTGTGTGIARANFVAYHQFFGTGDTDRERCAGDSRPLGGDLGARWTFECVQGELVTPWVGEVLGDDTVAVDGVSVAADRVVMTTTDGTGDNEMRIETWYRAGSDLILREIGSRRTTDPSPIGDVRYHEDYEIVLTELEPLR